MLAAGFNPAINRYNLPRSTAQKTGTLNGPRQVSLDQLPIEYIDEDIDLTDAGEVIDLFEDVGRMNETSPLRTGRIIDKELSATDQQKLIDDALAQYKSARDN